MHHLFLILLSFIVGSHLLDVLFLRLYHFLGGFVLYWLEQDEALRLLIRDVGTLARSSFHFRFDRPFFLFICLRLVQSPHLALVDLHRSTRLHHEQSKIWKLCLSGRPIRFLHCLNWGLLYRFESCRGKDAGFVAAENLFSRFRHGGLAAGEVCHLNVRKRGSKVSSSGTYKGLVQAVHCGMWTLRILQGKILSDLIKINK